MNGEVPGTGFQVSGTRSGNRIFVQFTRDGGSGYFDWTLKADGSIAGTYEDYGARNGGTSIGVRQAAGEVPTNVALSGNSPAVPTSVSFPDGAYIVPSEVPHGTYRNQGGSFCEVYRDAQHFAYGGGQFLVIVDSTWNTFRSTNCGTWSLVNSTPVGPRFPDGAYIVPAEVIYGTYRNDGDSFCEVYRDSKQFAYGGGQHLIVVDNGWHTFRSTNCGTWSRVAN